MSRRQIVVDTETTGLEVVQGHRVIEIACLEMAARRLTGNIFHHYLNPKRDIDEAAAEVHGFTAEQLADKPEFSALAGELLEFIKGAELIIHNAPFDVGFLNHEFQLAGHSGERGRGVIEAHCEVTDTLKMARDMFPGHNNSLKGLCQRYSVDDTQRILHGARLDAELLVDVYLAMTGGQVPLLDDAADSPGRASPEAIAPPADAERIATPLIVAGGEDLQAHEKWLELLDKESEAGVVWRRVEDAD